MSSIIVMPVHNALPYVQRSVLQVLKTGRHLVLVDDFSDQPTADYCQQLAKNDPDSITYLRNSRQQLFTRTVNRGLRCVDKKFNPPYVAVVNSDCDYLPEWLDAMELTMRLNPDVGLVGYRDAPLDQPWPKFEGVTPMYEEVEPPNYITGHCILHRMTLLRDIGIYCETDLTGLHFSELAPYHGLAHIGSDRLISYKIHEAGYKTVYSNYAGVRHEAGKSWNHDLGWLHTFDLDPLWEPKDTL